MVLKDLAIQSFFYQGLGDYTLFSLELQEAGIFPNALNSPICELWPHCTLCPSLSTVVGPDLRLQPPKQGHRQDLCL